MKVAPLPRAEDCPAVKLYQQHITHVFYRRPLRKLFKRELHKVCFHCDYDEVLVRSSVSMETRNKDQ